MNRDIVLQWLRKAPFQPFRVHLSDGTTHEVRHPECALLTRTTLHLETVPVSGTRGERTVECGLLHVTHLERLAPVAA